MNILLRFFELIGLRKVIYFKQTNEFKIDENTTVDEIKTFLINSPKNAQLHVSFSYLDEDNPEFDGETLLIQHSLTNEKQFLICYTKPFDMTAWEKAEIDTIAKAIYAKKSFLTYNEISQFKLHKKAIEGKAFGEY